MPVPVAPAPTGMSVETLNIICEERFIALQKVHEHDMDATREIIAEHYGSIRAILAEHDARYEVRFEQQEQANKVALEAGHAVLVEHDKRYEQRFAAQENATALALNRVDKEFHEHLAQVRAETHAALEAADKAIIKSENATEKRFESVNEFRGQLADQASRFMPRAESLQRHEQNAEKLDGLDKRFREDMARVNSRLDLSAGRSTGLDKGWALLVGAVALAGTVIAIILNLNP